MTCVCCSLYVFLQPLDITLAAPSTDTYLQAPVCNFVICYETVSVCIKCDKQRLDQLLFSCLQRVFCSWLFYTVTLTDGIRYRKRSSVLRLVLLQFLFTVCSAMRSYNIGDNSCSMLFTVLIVVVTVSYLVTRRGSKVSHYAMDLYIVRSSVD